MAVDHEGSSFLRNVSLTHCVKRLTFTITTLTSQEAWRRAPRRCLTAPAPDSGVWQARVYYGHVFIETLALSSNDAVFG